MNDNPKTSLEFLLGEMSNNLSNINKHLGELNGKVAKHERFMNEHIGRASAWGIVGGVLVTVVFFILQRIWPK